LGHFVKAMQSRICDLFILFNLLLADKSTKKKHFPFFSLTNIIFFYYYFDGCNTPKKVGTETK